MKQLLIFLGVLLTSLSPIYSAPPSNNQDKVYAIANPQIIQYLNFYMELFSSVSDMQDCFFKTLDEALSNQKDKDWELQFKKEMKHLSVKIAEAKKQEMSRIERWGASQKNLIASCGLPHPNEQTKGVFLNSVDEQMSFYGEQFVERTFNSFQKLIDSGVRLAEFKDRFSNQLSYMSYTTDISSTNQVIDRLNERVDEFNQCLEDAKNVVIWNQDLLRGNGLAQREQFSNTLLAHVKASL